MFILLSLSSSVLPRNQTKFWASQAQNFKRMWSRRGKRKQLCQPASLQYSNSRSQRMVLVRDAIMVWERSIFYETQASPAFPSLYVCVCISHFEVFITCPVCAWRPDTIVVDLSVQNLVKNFLLFFTVIYGAPSVELSNRAVKNKPHTR